MVSLEQFCYNLHVNCGGSHKDYIDWNKVSDKDAEELEKIYKTTPQEKIPFKYSKEGKK